MGQNVLSSGQKLVLSSMIQEITNRENSYGRRKCPSQRIDCKELWTMPWNKTFPSALVQCKKCGFRFCVACGHDAHKGACEKLAIKIFAFTPEELIAHRQSNTQECSKCGVMVQKIKGCPHMKCTNCGNEFCIDCGVQWPFCKHWAHRTWGTLYPERLLATYGAQNDR